MKWIDEQYKPASVVDVIGACPEEGCVHFVYWDDQKAKWHTSEWSTPIEVSHWMPIPAMPGEPEGCPMCAHAIREGHGCDNCEGIPT